MSARTFMRGWKEMTADTSWEDYGGTWTKRGPQKIRPFDPKARSGKWYVLRFTNLWDAMGMKDAKASGASQYECDVVLVDLDETPISAILPALKSSGYYTRGADIHTIYDQEGHELEPGDDLNLRIVDACVSYGLFAPLASFNGDKRPLNVRAAARRFAVECMKDDAKLNALLERTVNKIGSTARECGRGDALAGLHRLPLTPEKILMRKMFMVKEGPLPVLDPNVDDEGLELGGEVKKIFEIIAQKREEDEETGMVIFEELGRCGSKILIGYLGDLAECGFYPAPPPLKSMYRDAYRVSVLRPDGTLERSYSGRDAKRVFNARNNMDPVT